MKYLDEYRDPKLVKSLLDKIRSLHFDKPVFFMEVCGTHTMSIYKYGIKNLIPQNIKLISGPGCPVCVSPISYIDKAIYMANYKDVIITTYGDLMRVPGSYSTLYNEKSKGNDIRIVYSTLDALKTAEDNPDKQIVFLGIGFETTAPTIAISIMEAYKKNISNYSVLCSNKTMPEAMELIASASDIKINGFICPAHVSAVIGTKPYEILADKYKKPCVITGFEPADIIQGLIKLVLQVKNNDSKVENQYFRVVKKEGNIKMTELMEEVYDKCDTEWRGLSIIKNSGLCINQKYKNFDTEYKFDIKINKPREYKECLCGEILTGKKHPSECKLFGTACTPLDPKGACMVSSEGTCAAYFKHGK